jgi:hypothetical protein
MASRILFQPPDEAFWSRRASDQAPIIGFGAKTEPEGPTTRAFQHVLREVFGSSSPTQQAQPPDPLHTMETTTGVDAEMEANPPITKTINRKRKRPKNNLKRSSFTTAYTPTSDTLSKSGKKSTKKAELQQYAAPKVEVLSPWLNNQPQQ